jgi:hypothetical protein
MLAKDGVKGLPIFDGEHLYFRLVAMNRGGSRRLGDFVRERSPRLVFLVRKS